MRVEVKDGQFHVFSGNGVFVTRFAELAPAMDYVVECLQDDEGGGEPELGAGVPREALVAARERVARTNGAP